MAKTLYIAEKPSVAREFARVLGQNMKSHDGYQESEEIVVTWCIGHLITMSYPEAYDGKYKKWSLSTLPFLPEEFRYEVIPAVEKQFRIVERLLNRADVETIYICTDSGREGEYIYRLVDQMAQVHDKKRLRVWIDSQTEEEIRRGINEAKDWSAYDNLSASAYLRAKEDYLMGINFSRLLTLKYGNALAHCLQKRYAVISVGRVMTCVQGMVVRREREIRDFKKTPFYRLFAALELGDARIEAEWKAVEGSRYYRSTLLYKENGFKERKDAEALKQSLLAVAPQEMTVIKAEKKTERKNPPLLYNLAELQNDCSKAFHIRPDQTLQIAQELYEKKLITYPRTDARVLSAAVAKQIDKNLQGLTDIGAIRDAAESILEQGLYKNLTKTKYVNDKQITDHYAIIPTGQGLGALRSISDLSRKVYSRIVRRFLAIFLPAATYKKISLRFQMDSECFFASFRFLSNPGWKSVYGSVRQEGADARNNAEKTGGNTLAAAEASAGEEERTDPELYTALAGLKKGSRLPVCGYSIREGETTPPKRYTSGSLILAMENAGAQIEDEELREQIRSSGIGTSATRAEILKKLVRNQYISLNQKNQVITPTLQGELIYDIVNGAIPSLLNPELTASWEMGLTYVANGELTEEDYMEKLKGFIERRTERVRGLNNPSRVRRDFERISVLYKEPEKKDRKEKPNVAK